VLFVAIQGWMLARSDFLPYVFDNNESFSAFVHGKNMYEFDQQKSRWLTDEAYGSDPSAHPYVYTHQGNFPRMFTFLLYAAGARTPELQIAIATFTIGLGTTLLVLLFFTRLISPTYGLIAALGFVTDYLLFCQWQANTFRVWQAFLPLAALAATQAAVARKRADPRFLCAIAAAIACSAYFELVLAVFTSVLVGSFALFTAGNSPTGRRLIASVAAGGALGLSVLILQLVAYYGIGGLLLDISYTYKARNLADSAGINYNEIVQWFRDSRVVFWDMYLDGSQLRRFDVFSLTLSKYGWIVYTPFFSTIVHLLVISIGIGASRRWIQNLRLDRSRGSLYSALAFGFGWLLIAPIVIARADVFHHALIVLGLLGVFALLGAYAAVRFNTVTGHAIRIGASLAPYRRALSGSLSAGAFVTVIAALAAIWQPAGEIQISLAIWSGLGFALISCMHSLSEDYSNPCLTAHADRRTFSWVLTAHFLLFVLFIAANFLVLSVVFSEHLVGFGRPLANLPALSGPRSIAIAAVLAISIPLASVFVRRAWPFVFSQGSISARDAMNKAGAIFRAASVLTIAGALPWTTDRFYNLPWSQLWSEVLRRSAIGDSSSRFFFLTAVIAGICMAVRTGDSPSGARRLPQLSPFLSYMTAVLLAYGTAYYFSPGNMYAVQLGRFTPVLIFFIAPLAAFALWYLGSEVLACWQLRKVDEYGAVRPALLVFGATTLTALVAYWPVLQATYMDLAPPDGGAVYKKLMASPYRGKSFITNTYAAPAAASTGSWAYINPTFFEGAQTERLSGGRGFLFSENYLWFSDSHNAGYRYPEYALCFITPDFNAVLWRLDSKYHVHGELVGCRRLADLILRANPGASQLAEYDTGSLGGWAILKLPAQQEPPP
jgi:hypothetical protein